MENSMKKPTAPFSMPETVETKLGLVHAYWRDLKRGANEIPFSDDVILGELADLQMETMLIEVFENPLRFRFDIVGQKILDRYAKTITGKFVDEVVLRNPFEQLDTQCNATLNSRAPTYYRHQAPKPYSRIILPLWGNGRIDMLLGAVV
jgi:hypothetical protein